MSNITKKAANLQAILEKHNLLHKAGSEIQHIESPENQGSQGKAQQAKIEEGCGGDYASGTDSAAIKEVPGQYVDGQDTCGKTTLEETGTTVKNIDTFGNAQGTPAQVAKTAALKQKLKACVDLQMRKQAAAQEAAESTFVTATEVMTKVAALTNETDQKAFDALTRDIEMDFTRLHKANPLFGPACEYVAMRKMASEIEALANSEGISEEQAAEALDAAMSNDPAAQEEFNNEVEGEALSELAGAEAEAEAVMAGLQDAAAQVSELTGTAVTADDIVMAIEDVSNQAAELGVEPEVLIQEALDQMMAGEPEVTPEDEAIAEQLIEEAAAQGISPQELIQGLSEEVAAEEAAPTEGAAPVEEAPAEAPAQEAPAEDVQKTACLQRLASTKRGANLIKVLAGK